MIVTIFTDASYSETYKRGAWATAMRADDLDVRTSAKIKTVVDDNNLCELMAIANALTVLKRHKKLQDCRVIIWTDSASAIKHIHTDRGFNFYQTVIRYIRTQLAQTQGYKLRHIQAHRFNENHKEYSKPKYHMNNWCDTAARKHLKEIVGKLEYESWKNKSKRREPVNRGPAPQYHNLKRLRSGAKPYKRSQNKARY